MKPDVLIANRLICGTPSSTNNTPLDAERFGFRPWPYVYHKSENNTPLDISKSPNVIKETINNTYED